jgi:hypothetical protein
MLSLVETSLPIKKNGPSDSNRESRRPLANTGDLNVPPPMPWPKTITHAESVHAREGVISLVS